MKALKLTVIGLVTAITAGYAAEVSDVMQITYKNGGKAQFNVAEIEEITFQESAEAIYDDVDGHQTVDLGLPSGLRWSTCNIGADSPYSYGNFYAWGELSTKSLYDIFKGKWCGYTYQQLQDQGVINADGTLTPQYDVATVEWGSNWRMPTKEEYEELIENCTFRWISQGNMVGVVITGRNGNSMFLPAAGNYHEFGGKQCNYWSSTAYGPDDRAWSFFATGEKQFVTKDLYGTGIPVRPVTTEFNVMSAPKNVEAVFADGLITVTWDAVEGATSYTVYRSTNGTDYTELGTATTTSYIDNSPNRKWNYYRVRAFGDNGDKSGMSLPSTRVKGEDAGDPSSHESVDLGLPSGLLWAACNLGADTPSAYGNYYAWGEDEAKTQFTPVTLWADMSFEKLLSIGVIDSEGNLTPEYDTASIEWGGDWRMPSAPEVQELVDNCTWTWTTQDGHYGSLVTGPNGNSIFLPASGYMIETNLNSTESEGNFWTSTVYEYNGTTKAMMAWYTSNSCTIYDEYRYIGVTVRAVMPKDK